LSIDNLKRCHTVAWLSFRLYSHTTSVVIFTNQSKNYRFSMNIICELWFFSSFRTGEKVRRFFRVGNIICILSLSNFFIDRKRTCMLQWWRRFPSWMVERKFASRVSKPQIPALLIVSRSTRLETLPHPLVLVRDVPQLRRQVRVLLYAVFDRWVVIFLDCEDHF
jgi:hypothetical protein